MIKNKTKGTCELCNRISILEKHHLKPKKSDETSLMCVDCARQVHALFTRTELRQKYNTIAKLKTSPKIQKYLKWIKKRPIMNLHPSMKK